MLHFSAPMWISTSSTSSTSTLSFTSNSKSSFTSTFIASTTKEPHGFVPYQLSEIPMVTTGSTVSQRFIPYRIAEIPTLIPKKREATTYNWMEELENLINEITQNKRREFQISRGGALRSFVRPADSVSPPTSEQEIPVIGGLYEGDLPRAINLDIVVWYDNSLLQQMSDSETETKQWIAKIVELARPRLALPSLNVRINPIIRRFNYTNTKLEANTESMQLIKNLPDVDPNFLNIFFCYDEKLYGKKGMASQGSACSRDGNAISIVEYQHGQEPELNTARVLVHEIGHNLGIWQV